ncbi:MAG: MFS transporter [Alphaproteobacteria bacterium]|nr:MFS transporter [Alphaproteobacteria bacterium]
MGTGAFVVAGILPLLADGLGTSVSAAGFGVTVYGLVYAATAPLINAWTQRFERRRVILTGVSLLVLGNVAAALAPGIELFLASRMVTALGGAMFSPVATAAVAALADERNRGRALAQAASGIALSTVLGVPLGTFLGYQIGWRATFLAIAAAGAIVAIGMAWAFPAIGRGSAGGFLERLRLVRDLRVLPVLLATALWTTGSYTVYTYVAPIFADIAAFDPARIDRILLLQGAVSVGATFFTGRFVDRVGADRAVVAGFAGLAVSFACLGLLGLLPRAELLLWPAILCVVAWALCGWTLHPGQQSRLIALAPGNAAVALALYASAIYVGIASGAALGGLLLGHLPPGKLAFVGAACEAAALVLVIVSRRRSAGL